jgi:hypothetical protein
MKTRPYKHCENCGIDFPKEFPEQFKWGKEQSFQQQRNI